MSGYTLRLALISFRSPTADEGGKREYVSQKCFGEGNDIGGFYFGEVMLFMSRGISIKPYFLCPVRHICGDFSIDRQLFESFFKPPCLVHCFGGKIQCSTTQKDGSFKVFSLKVFYRLTKRGLDLLWAVHRYCETLYHWIVSIDSQLVRRIKVNGHMGVAAIHEFTGYTAKFEYVNFSAVVALSRHAYSRQRFYPYTRQKYTLCLAMSAFLACVKNCHMENRPDSWFEVNNAY